jgi:hypothetical protein
MAIRLKLILEFSIKNLIVIVLGLWSFLFIRDKLQNLPTALQGSILSMQGLLMAAGIIGAFELTYTRTNMRICFHRYLAHITKAMLFLGVGMLLIIALGAMGQTPGSFNDPVFFASVLVYGALYLHDTWDFLKAIEDIA